MTKNYALTEKERIVLDILITKKTIAEGSSELRAKNISLSTAYKVIERISDKASQWLRSVNQIQGYRKKSKSYYGLLDRRITFKTEPITKTEEEEEEKKI